jgi:hypothetical protein
MILEDNWNSKDLFKLTQERFNERIPRLIDQRSPWILLLDNDPVHMSRMVQGWLNANRVETMHHPLISPDLNGIL